MLIGLTGCKGSGKDTVGQYLVDKYDFKKIAFADKLKEAVANLFGLTVEQVDEMKSVGVDNLPKYELFLMKMGSTTEWSYDWREFLQRFGTEMGRETFGQHFWVQQWARRFHSYDPDVGGADYPNVVATDVRFENEAIAILEEDGHIIEITRPGYEPDGHVSEEPLPRDFITAQILNNGTILDLHVDVDDLMEEL